MKLRIISNGTTIGTQLIDADTGNTMNGLGVKKLVVDWQKNDVCAELDCVVGEVDVICKVAEQFCMDYLRDRGYEVTDPHE